MTINDKIKQEIVGLLKKQKVKIKIEELETPPSAEMGDWALPCFNLAKEFKRAPQDIAKDFAQNLKPSGLIINFKSIGPYLNFMIDASKVAELVLKEINKSKGKYGQSKIGKKEKVMIEYSQPNTHKEFHVGHLRNVCIGASLVNLYKNCGYKVISANYPADSGAHVAKTLWYLQNYTNQTDIPSLPEDRGEFLGQTYARAVAELTDHPELKPQVQDIMLKLEAGDKALIKLWQETRQWSLDQFKKIYKELGVDFDVWFYESVEEKEGKKMLPKLLKHNFIKKSEGAIIADLAKYNLGILVLIRQDGTALYGIKDIALGVKKFKKYKVKKSIYVVDTRQSQYLKQIFKILELMGFKKAMIHVAYEFVELKSGIISSRTGNIVTYEEVRDVALNKVLAETKERHSDWSEKKIIEVSLKIVLAALKFGMLKSGNDKVITFDINESLDLNGFTGPYLQYTLARLNSIFRKIKGISARGAVPAGRQGSAFGGKIDYKNLAALIEIKLIKDLLAYPDKISESLKLNDPSIIAQYLFKLAQDFNAFYHELPVLKSELDVQAARLELLWAIGLVLENGMGLLGLSILEEM
ncbi:MAG: arginine--tRNA ligase [Candidatus Parcubacteria bacterium]|nr:arginine--tRNA ligase [Candidatus Parcubacteria bacterium]